MQPTPDIDTILNRVRAKINYSPGRENGSMTVAATPTPKSASPKSPVSGNSHYTLADLLSLDNQQFIYAAYRQLLKREADGPGAENCLTLLRHGMSRTAVLASLRFSEEGSRVRAEVQGLKLSFWKWRITQLRLYLRQILSGLLNVPTLIAKFGKLNSEMALAEVTLAEYRRDLDSVLHSKVIAELQQHIARLEYGKANRIETTALAERYDSVLAAKADRQELDQLKEQLARKVDELSAKAEHEQLAALAEQLKHKADNDRISADLGDLLHSLVELQQHVARLEYGKANRTEISTLADRYDSLLAAVADRQDLQELASQLARKVDEERLVTELSGKVDRRELGELAGEVARKAEKEHLTAQIQRIDSLTIEIHELAAAKAERSEVRGMEERVNGLVVGLGTDMASTTHQITLLRQELRDCQRKLGVFLEQARKRMPEPLTAGQIKEMIIEGSDFLDSLYIAFEDRFRGPYDSVRDGMKLYLPYVKEAFRATKGAPVLDVACGRGEWLDLLREEGIPALGVDLNRAAVELCRQQQQEVMREDALTYLRKQLKNSFSAVTSFHFIEHIDYQSLIAMLDEALRILKPGGVAIFETPNARNILVSAGDFYRDPTHHHPVFPETIEAIAEMRGFDSKVYCVNEGRTELIPLSQYCFNSLQDYVSVPRDLAWVGVKPS